MEFDCHKVIPVSELKLLLTAESRGVLDFDQQLKTNKAFVYSMKTGKVVVLPNDLSDNSNGLLFNNKSCFEQCISLDKFPIDNQNKTLEEKFQPDILNIDKQIERIILDLSAPYGFQPNPPPLEILLRKLKSSKGKRSDQMTLYSGLVLGEYLRRAVRGKWVLLKTYGTFNPYYTIGIVYPNMSVVILRDAVDMYFFGSSIAPESFIELPFIQSPSLKIKNTNFVEYRILQ